MADEDAVFPQYPRLAPGVSWATPAMWAHRPGAAEGHPEPQARPEEQPQAAVDLMARVVARVRTSPGAPQTQAPPKPRRAPSRLGAVAGALCAARPRRPKTAKQAHNLAPHAPHGDRAGGPNGKGAGHNRLQIPGDPATGRQATYPTPGKRGVGFYGRRKKSRLAQSRGEPAAGAQAEPLLPASLPPPLQPAAPHNESTRSSRSGGARLTNGAAGAGSLPSQLRPAAATRDHGAPLTHCQRAGGQERAVR